MFTSLLNGLVLLALTACASGSSHSATGLLSRADSQIRNGQVDEAKLTLALVKEEGSSLDQARAGFSICELENSPGKCYKELATALANEPLGVEIADIYALSLYRHFALRLVQQRLDGFLAITRRCPATPAALKAAHYLQAEWASLLPEQRLIRWGSGQAESAVFIPVSCPQDSNSSQITALLAMERANAFLQMGRPLEGIAVLEQAWPKIETSVWWDDVAILWGEALKFSQRYEDALERLQVFLERREESYIVGSYESAHFDDAMMLRGELFELLGRRNDARMAYLRFAQNAPTSLLCDDATYRAALLEDNVAKRNTALQGFLAKYPESRWAKRARKFLQP